MHTKEIQRGNLAIVTLLMLVSTSSFALAGTLDGTSKTIDENSFRERWTLSNGAMLTAINATTIGITSTNSIVNLSNVTNNGTLALNNGSVATVTDTFLSAAGSTGITFGNSTGVSGDGMRSAATVTNSTINGATGTGARVEYGGVLNLINSTLYSTRLAVGTGLVLTNGETNISAGSSVIGNRNGIRITSTSAAAVDYGRVLKVDGSTITSNTGAAISVVGSTVFGDPRAEITITNGSTLKSGNGNLLELDKFSSAKFIVDSSVLEGNISVEDGGFADILIQNNGSIKGMLAGVDALSLNSGGTWVLTGNASIGSLAMDRGIVEIGAQDSSAFNILTLASLSGRGTFIYNTDLSVPTGDKLVITGTAEGSHELIVRSTGLNPSKENSLTLVETTAGDATFTLRNGVVELGVYKYYLNKLNGNWVLTGQQDVNPVEPGPKPEPNPKPEPGPKPEPEPNPKPNPEPEPGPKPEPVNLSESARTAISLHAATSNVWYSETGTLRQRISDVRQGKGENGIWGRTYGRGFKGNGVNDVNFDQNIWGLQAGAETETRFAGIPVILGVFGGYSNSDVKLDAGSEGEIDSGYGGVYATWLGNAGLYVDGLFKINRFSHNANVLMADGIGSSGDYSATGFGGEIELGKTHNFGNDWFATPFARLSVFHISSFNYGLSNGLKVNGDIYRSVQGRFGATFGLNHTLGNGSLIQPYVRLAVAQEFIDDNKLFINSVAFNNAFNGTRGEVGSGIAYQIGDRLQLHADIDFSAGKDIDRNWGGNFGLSYKF